MDYKQHAAEAIAAKATYAASGGAILLGLTANEVAAIGGLIVAFIAMIVQAAISWHFKSQHLKLARDMAATGKCGNGNDE